MPSWYEILERVCSCKRSCSTRKEVNHISIARSLFAHVSDKSKAIDALVTPLQTPYTDASTAAAQEEDAEEEAEEQADPEAIHILDLAHCTRTYKTLLTGGHFDTTSKTVNVVDSSLSAQFAKAAWSALISSEAGGEENAVRLAKGNAPFVVVELIEALKRAGKGAEIKRVLGGKEVRKAIEGGEKKGSGLLVEKLAEL